jgi:cyanophycin synthetase
MNRGIEAAVIENSQRTILSSGLGYDRCAVGVVTGIDPADTLPEFYIEQADQIVNVLRTQVDVVLPGGCAVLNAADPLVASMARLCDGEVIFFAGNAEVPAMVEHLTQGGRAVYVRAGRVLFASGNTHTPIAGPATLPLPHSPELTQVLAAAAAAWAMGMTPQEIGAELAVFLDELRSDFDRAVPGARAAHC